MTPALPLTEARARELAEKHVAALAPGYRDVFNPPLVGLRVVYAHPRPADHLEYRWTGAVGLSEQERVPSYTAARVAVPGDAYEAAMKLGAHARHALEGRLGLRILTVVTVVSWSQTDEAVVDYELAAVDLDPASHAPPGRPR